MIKRWLYKADQISIWLGVTGLAAMTLAIVGGVYFK